MTPSREPVAYAAAIRAILLCAVAFGLHWTPEQIASFMLAVEAVLAIFTRASVTPNGEAGMRVDPRHLPAWLLVAVLAGGVMGCAPRPVDPATPVPPVDWAAVADGTHATLLIAEQAQALEIALHIAQDVDDVVHCRIQRGLVTFSGQAAIAVRLLFDTRGPGGDRVRAIRTLVAGVNQVVADVAPRLRPETVVALRTGLTAGTVALLTLDAQRIQTTIPPEVLVRLEELQDVLYRMRTLGQQACPAARTVRK